jgi:hypothetical protein
MYQMNCLKQSKINILEIKILKGGNMQEREGREARTSNVRDQANLEYLALVWRQTHATHQTHGRRYWMLRQEM